MALETMLQIIRAETVLVNELTRTLEGVLTGVMKRDNAAVQSGLSLYHQLSANLAKAEAMRSRLYETMCRQYQTKSADGMGTIIARLSNEERPQFSYALRSFRAALYQLYAVNRCLSSYTSSQLTTLEAFLVEIMPERDNGTYQADGKRPSTSRPVLVNSLG